MGITEKSLVFDEINNILKNSPFDCCEPNSHNFFIYYTKNSQDYKTNKHHHEN